MDYQIYKDEKEKQQAAIDLESLIASPGWQIVMKALDINEAHEDNKLHTERYADVKEFYLQQDIVEHLRNLKQLPKLLIEEARKFEQPEPPDDSDVYDSPAADSQPK